MITTLKTTNVGPQDLNLSFTQVNNTGTENKSFLYNLLWRALTGKWPNERNPVVSGYAAYPRDPKLPANITLVDEEGTRQWSFSRKEFAWVEKPKHKRVTSQIVVYAMEDGFAVYDPFGKHIQLPQGFVVSAHEIFNRVNRLVDMQGTKKDTTICAGVISDVDLWMITKDVCTERDILKAVTDIFLPSVEWSRGVRIDLNDCRDIPQVTWQGNKVPILHAPSTVRRLASLSYLLTWAWTRHKDIAKWCGAEPTQELVLLHDGTSKADFSKVPVALGYPELRVQTFQVSVACQSTK